MTNVSTQDSDTTEELRRQVHESRSVLVKVTLVIVGSICVALGVLGIILPILPTTPFLLLAAICYSHSSERFYLWLLSNRFFGHYIRDWRENRGLSIAVKLWVIFVLVVTMGISIVFFIPILPVKVLCIVTGIVITAYIWSLPTKRDVFIDENGE
jgi:uncharacterized protein